MKIAIMGTGGQGGLFGSLLHNAGHDVTLIARGRNLKALQDKGLTLKSKDFGDHIVSVKATNRPEEAGTVDLVIFCVKTYDLEDAANQIKPMIGPDTIVLTVQNGVEAPYELGEIIGSTHVIAGVSRINSHLSKPGEVSHHGGKALVIGELSGEITSRIKLLEQVLREPGFDIVVSDNIKWNLWQKLSTLSGIHGVCSMIRSTIGTIYEYKETQELMLRVILETTTVARAEGVEIPREMVDATVEGISKMPPEIKPSMLVDILEGRRIEIDTFNGAVIRFGKKHGIETPYNYAVYATLLPYANGSPK